MVKFNLETEVELTSPEQKISSAAKDRAESDLLNQAIDEVVYYLDQYNFNASDLSDEDILYYCSLKFGDAPVIEEGTYVGDPAIAYFYLTCYFDNNKFFQDYDV